MAKTYYRDCVPNPNHLLKASFITLEIQYQQDQRKNRQQSVNDSVVKSMTSSPTKRPETSQESNSYYNLTEEGLEECN